MLFRKELNNYENYIYSGHNIKQYNPNTLETDIQKLLMDNDVTKNVGIIPVC